MLQIDEQQSGAEAEVAPGTSVEIQLYENPTTGYRWSIVAVGSPVLELQESLFLPSDTGGLGKGGVRRVRLRAEREGVATIELLYARSWEETSAGSFKFTVHVRSDVGGSANLTPTH